MQYVLFGCFVLSFARSLWSYSRGQDATAAFWMAFALLFRVGIE